MQKMTVKQEALRSLSNKNGDRHKGFESGRTEEKGTVWERQFLLKKNLLHF